MIAISRDFCQFSREKNLAFFSKTNVLITFLQKLAVVWVKTPILSPISLAKIFFKS
jgi:hypothetical protein